MKWAEEERKIKLAKKEDVRTCRNSSLFFFACIASCHTTKSLKKNYHLTPIMLFKQKKTVVMLKKWNWAVLTSVGILSAIKLAFKWSEMGGIENLSKCFVFGVIWQPFGRIQPRKFKWYENLAGKIHTFDKFYQRIVKYWRETSRTLNWTFLKLKFIRCYLMDSIQISIVLVYWFMLCFIFFDIFSIYTEL